MSYSTSAHCKFHNRYHIVWITKYRYKVLTRDIRLRVQTLTRQICKKLGVRISKVFYPVITFICLQRFRQNILSVMLCGLLKEPHLVRYKWSFQNFESDTGDVGSGQEDTFVQHQVMSPMKLYFSIQKITQTNLPTPVGSGLVIYLIYTLSLLSDCGLNMCFF